MYKFKGYNKMSRQRLFKNRDYVDYLRKYDYTDEEVLHKGFGLLSLNELKGMATHRLLSYFKKNVQRLPSQVANLGRCDCCGIRNVYSDNDKILYCNYDIAEKITQRYKDEVKEILADREHIE